MSDLLTETHRLVTEIHAKVGGHGATLDAHDQRIERIENRLDGSQPHIALPPPPATPSRHSPVPREIQKIAIYALLIAAAGGIGALIHAMTAGLAGH